MLESSTLTKHEISTLLLIKRLLCIPSVVFCCLILCFLWFFKEIRGPVIEIFFFLVISEIFYLFSLLIPFYSDNPKGILCTTQAFLINFFLQSRYIWAIIISFASLMVRIKYNYLDHHKSFYRVFFLIIGLIIPLGLSIYIIVADITGNSGYFCLLDIDTEDRRKYIVRNEIFFLGIKGTEMFIILFFVLKNRAILKGKKKKNQHADNEHIIYYPGIILVASLGRLMNSIVSVVTLNNMYFWIYALQVVLDALEGICIFITFLATPGLRHSISTVYINLRKRQFDRPSLIIAQGGIMDSQDNILYPSINEIPSGRSSSLSSGSKGKRITDEDDDDDEQLQDIVIDQ